MKSVVITFVATWLLASSAMAAPAADADRVFAEAATAYDAGRFADAAQGYESIISHGHASHELFFNLGNARYKQGRLGEAVLQYRRAWMLSPRDPGAEANLRVAAQGTSALLPDMPLVSVLFFKLSFREWLWIAVLSYWACAVLVALHLFMARRRPLLRRLFAVTAFAAVLGVAGAGHWYALHRRPELVILAPDQQALFAPMENSTPHFALPPGSVVRMVESSGPWIKVAYGKEIGWVQQSACAAVYPWQPPG